MKKTTMKIKVKLSKRRIPLPAKPPKIEVPKNVYKRRSKHSNDTDNN